MVELSTEEGPPREISERAQRRILFIGTGIAWGLFLLSFLPYDTLGTASTASTFTFALVLSWMLALVSLWDSIQSRRRWCYLAAALSVPLAVFCGLRLGVLLGFIELASQGN
jgi:hypothetical protein